MSKYLFEVQAKNRLAQKGVLRRFSINCMGHQETIEEMRAEKAEKFKELKDKKKTPEYDAWFLRYRPTDSKTKGDDKKDDSKTDGKKDGSKDEEEENEKEPSSSKQKTKSKRKRVKKTKKTGFFF